MVTSTLISQSVVIDTNVALDWMVFDHPDGRLLGAALSDGALSWIATAAMRDEFFHVLARGTLDDWNPNLPALQSQWDRHCPRLLEPPPALAGAALRCTDPDDQKFIDLAAAHPGALLLSRDRAVLKLAPKLARLNVRTMTPTRWASAMPSPLTEPTC